ncbi:MAG: TauD/TfdA dioxygenase family protein [Acidimicrobiales bacterium]
MPQLTERDAETARYETITVTKLSPAVGAEIGGVDIAAGIGDEQFEEIRRAYIDNGVVFFRDQDISPDQHIAFAERWGDININRFFKPVDTHPQIAEVRKEPDQDKNIGVNWHTDHSYDQVPAMGSVLYAREVPAIGGDTCFAGMAAAYEALSEGMKQTLRGLRAEHSSRHAFGAVKAKQATGDIADRIGNPEAATQDAVHPVVIEHPLSGRPSLYVNTDFTLRFEGWTDEESKPLLEFLYRHATSEAFACRFRWEQGSMAIWDNRAVQHKALNDYHGQRRLMHRITIDGEKLAAAA